MTWVHKGQLTATFLYPTPGAEGVRQGLKIVKGEKVEKKVYQKHVASRSESCSN